MKHKPEKGCGRCSPKSRREAMANTVPSAKPWETPDETEERKWICYLIRRRPRALTIAERRVLDRLYALDCSVPRVECREVAKELGLAGVSVVHEIAGEALKKICYEPRRRRA